MGVHDEHWCSECRKPLDKRTEQYIQTEVINVTEQECEKKGTHARAFLCLECYEKKENAGFKKTNEKIRKKGNPTFTCTVSCGATKVCADFAPAKDKRVNCRNIYALGDQLYCGRRHPGKTIVNQDKATVDNDLMSRVGGFTKKMMKKVGFPMAKGADPLAFLGGAIKLKTKPTLGDFMPRVPMPIFSAPDRDFCLHESVKPEDPCLKCGAFPGEAGRASLPPWLNTPPNPCPVCGPHNGLHSPACPHAPDYEKVHGHPPPVMVPDPKNPGKEIDQIDLDYDVKT